MTVIALLVTLLGLSVSGLTADPPEFTVTYLSAEHVYIDGGAEDGLQIGHKLALASSGSTPVLEIVYVSGHSASCRPLANAPTLAVGSRLRLLPAPTTDTTDTLFIVPEVQVSPTLTTSDVQFLGTPNPVRLSGTALFGFYHFADTGPANLDFSQTNARLRLKVERLWNEHITLAVRTRGRYDARTGSYADVDRSGWENRLWELSVSYDNPASPFAFSAGRILPGRLSVSGYLDGVVLRWRPTSLLTVGLLGGQQPDWAYGLDEASVTRFGGYLSLGNRHESVSGLVQTLGAVVETRSGTTNRTFVVAQGSLLGRRWGVNHSAEIDINTGWREERAGESVALSRAYLHAYWQMLRPIRVSLSYDNLRRYWTYEYRTVADSLFDERVRQGVRARVDWTASQTWRFSFGGGLRDQPDNGDPTISYSASVRRSRLFARSLSTFVYVNGFEGDRERGLNYAIQIDALVSQLGLIHIRTGRYSYAVKSVDSDRSSWSIETGLDADIARRYYLSGLVQYNSGDDIDGWRLRTELGYRF